MLIRKFICENPSADNIMMFNFADCADKCLCQPWRFPITGSNTLVTLLYTDTRCTLYSLLTAINLDTNSFTSNCMLLLILAVSSRTDDFSICILGYVFGGCIGSITAA